MIDVAVLVIQITNSHTHANSCTSMAKAEGQ